MSNTTAAFHAEGQATISLPPKHSPWGPVQQARKLADGIWQVYTASHGGIWLSPERRKRVPQYIVDVTWLNTAEWFEEDCDQCWPRLIFAADLDEKEAWGADELLRSYKPEVLARLEADLGRITP